MASSSTSMTSPGLSEAPFSSAQQPPTVPEPKNSPG
jgi:hypothetical protein